jgi:hypothetical protein
MTEVQIPRASMERMRQAYGQFEQLTVIVAEALDIPATAQRRLDFERGMFVIEEPPNGRVAERAGIGNFAEDR